MDTINFPLATEKLGSHRYHQVWDQFVFEIRKHYVSAFTAGWVIPQRNAGQENIRKKRPSDLHLHHRALWQHYRRYRLQ
ncbi:MAG: hypothetical protein IPO36_08845 [Anaerolineales bacterium]|nr:hypothetical protein [Anaerolineales bacterium]